MVRIHVRPPVICRKTSRQTLGLPPICGHSAAQGRGPRLPLREYAGRPDSDSRCKGSWSSRRPTAHGPRPAGQPWAQAGPRTRGGTGRQRCRRCTIGGRDPPAAAPRRSQTVAWVSLAAALVICGGRRYKYPARLDMEDVGENGDSPSGAQDATLHRGGRAASSATQRGRSWKKRSAERSSACSTRPPIHGSWARRCAVRRLRRMPPTWSRRRFSRLGDVSRSCRRATRPSSGSTASPAARWRTRGAASSAIAL